MRYATVTPAKDGKYPTRTIHGLVCEAFYGSKPDGLTEVRHLDGDVDNNAPDNLDWGTISQNRLDREAHGTYSGEAHHNAKLTQRDVDHIRVSSESQRSLAADYGVVQSTIQEARVGRTWNPNPIAPPPNCERWVSPIVLRVTDVRVERVQEISVEDAKAEGVNGGCLVCGEPDPCGCDDPQPDHRDAFAGLWNEINEKRGHPWFANDWIWAISFERCEAPT